MTSHYDNTPSSSHFYLCPPSPDDQDISFDDPDFSTTYHLPLSVKYPQKTRKKRTKMIRLHPISKPKKPDPSAPKITRPCSECGKKFWSWKALFGHMRCHPERQWRGINPPPNFKKPDGGGGRSDTPSSWDDLGTRLTDEDYHVATCLLMLANTPISACDRTPTVISTTAAINVALPEHGMGLWNLGSDVFGFEDHKGSGGSNCRFECSSCKKVFGSHQALGGHRASHKNVKGCFAITRTEGEEYVVIQEAGAHHERNNNDEGRIDVGNSSDNTMVTHFGSGTSTALMPLSTHQCGICLRVFSSGQALGGHKRCHWEKLEDELVNAGGSSSITQGLNVGSFGLIASGLDLNVRPPVDDASSSVSYTSNLDLDLRLGL